MSCRSYRFLIATERAEALAANDRLHDHLAGCTACARLYREMQALTHATTALPPLQAPASFTQRVGQQIRGTAHARRDSLATRVLGPLRAPAPRLRPVHVMAGATVIVLALILIALVLQPLGAPSATPSLQVPSLAQPAGGQPIEYTPPRPHQRPLAPAPPDAP